MHIRQTINVKLPEEWDLEDERSKSSLPSMRYSYRADVSSRSFKLFCEYKSLADAVEPGDFPKYKAAMKEAEGNLYYALSYPLDGTVVGSTTPDDDGEVKSYVLLGLVAVCGLLCGLVLSVGAYFLDPPARVAELPAPRGLGGWLLLPVVFCFIDPVSTVIALSSYFSSMGVDGFTLFDGRADQVNWMVYFCIGAFTEAFLFPLTLLQLMLILRRRTSFPNVFIASAILFICQRFILLILGISVVKEEVDPTEVGQLVSGALGTLLWSAYMVQSRRVKATFTRGRKNPAPAQMPPSLPVQ